MAGQLCGKNIRKQMNTSHLRFENFRFQKSYRENNLIVILFSQLHPLDGFNGFGSAIFCKSNCFQICFPIDADNKMQTVK